MRRLVVSLLGLTLAGGLMGCASYFTRKECEKVNWYQHGYDVAMSGQRLDADNQIKQCQKANANFSFADADNGFKAGMAHYCSSDNVFAVGKTGKPFSYEMCDGESTLKLRGQYEKGLTIFCQPGNAYAFGTSGGVYQNVCPKDTEDGWLSEYKRGRKVYLSALISSKEEEVQRLNGELSHLESQRNALIFQQNSLVGQTIVRRTQVYDPMTNTYREQVIQQPDPDAQAQSQQLQSQISSVDWEINRTRISQEQLANEVSRLRTEMISL